MRQFSSPRLHTVCSDPASPLLGPSCLPCALEASWTSTRRGLNRGGKLHQAAACWCEGLMDLVAESPRNEVVFRVSGPIGHSFAVLQAPELSGTACPAYHYAGVPTALCNARNVPLEGQPSLGVNGGEFRYAIPEEMVFEPMQDYRMIYLQVVIPKGTRRLPLADKLHLTRVIALKIVLP